METSPVGLHAKVYGRVQGVNFRYYTLQRAQRLRLTGWVRNQPDGSVEVRAEGPRTAVEELLAFLHQGPPHAQVERVEAEWLPASGAFRRFDVQL
jgi:acylphosphatase